MIRPSRALGLVALLVAGLSVSVGASAAGTTGSDTTEPTGRPPRSVETTEPTETSEVATPPRSSTPPSSSRPPRAPRRPRHRRPPLPPFEPEPIEWTSLGDGLEEGRLEVPIDYADPDGADVQPVPRPPPRRRPRSAHRLAARQPGRARLRRDDLRRVGRVHLRPGPPRQLRHRRLGPPWHRRERAGHRLHRQLRRLLRRHRHHPRR